MSEHFDIVISGAGPAGLIAAAALAETGRSIVLIDPAPPITDGRKAGADWRSTAFLRPAIELFRQAGIWDNLAAHAQPLDALRIVDLAGDPPAFRDERCFRADDMGDGPFGWNFLNWQIRAALLANLEARENVSLRLGVGVRGMISRITGAKVVLDDGQMIGCALAVAADGRNSVLRENAGIGVTTTRYGQQSLAFSATHDVPHHDISTEIYHRGGPFTMVPLANIDGNPASAIVWMNPGPLAQELLRMDAAAFNAEMDIRSAGLFGHIRVASPRAAFPIITQRAERLAAERLVLIAETAHVLPPIGAQGLNTSVNDIAALLAALQAHPGDPGAPEVTDAYQHARSRDIHLRAKAIDLFNRVTRSGLPALQALRLSGLKVAHDIAPLRHGLMRAGMAPI